MNRPLSGVIDRSHRRRFIDDVAEEFFPDEDSAAYRRDSVGGPDPENGLPDLLASRTWKRKILPALRAHQALIGRRLATGQSLPLEEIRALQARHAVLNDLIERPDEFFSPPTD